MLMCLFIMGGVNSWAEEGTVFYSFTTTDTEKARGSNIDYTKSCKYKFRKKAQELHKEYDKLIKSAEDMNYVDRVDVIKLVDKYRTLISFLCIEIGVNTVYEDNITGGNSDEQ